MYSTSYINILDPMKLKYYIPKYDIACLPVVQYLHVPSCTAQTLVVILDSSSFCHCLYPISNGTASPYFKRPAPFDYVAAVIPWPPLCWDPCLPIINSIQSIRVVVLKSHNAPCFTLASELLLMVSRPYVILSFPECSLSLASAILIFY